MKRLLAGGTAAALLGLLTLVSGSPANGAEQRTLQRAVTGKLRPAVIPVVQNGRQVGVRQVPFLSGATLKAAEEAMSRGVSAANERIEAADGAVPAVGSGRADISVSPGSLGCHQRNTDGDVRVNQDCTFRRQAETDITYNPVNPKNLLAGQNDSRVGYNQCGIDYSLDNGATWGDQLPPFRQKVNYPAAQEPTSNDPNRHTILGGNGTLHTYDAGSDPAVAFDSQGRGFFSCVGFDVLSNASLLYVTTSPRGAQGSYFYNLGTLGSTTDRRFIVAEDNSARVFHDKEFITADANPSSPNRDNVYVTWTVFRFSPNCRGGSAEAFAFCQSPIYGSMSTDHGFTWSTPEQISGVNRNLCFFGNYFDRRANAHACNNSQGSDPTVLPNGDLAVSFSNANTAAGNPNMQVLALHCSPRGSSTAGTAHFNCGAPSKVGNQLTAAAPKCDFGRGPEQCAPGTFVRAPFETSPRIASNSKNGNVFVTWFDYRGSFVQNLAKSTDGGRTWSGSIMVDKDANNDHYFGAIDVAEVGNLSQIGISYYRTHQVPNENRTPNGGFAPGDPGVGQEPSDYRLAGGNDLSASSYRTVVVSPVFPPPDGVQTGFLGDYSGLTINLGTQAHPFWSDTRNRNTDPNNFVSRDEDVFTTTRQLP